MFMATAKPSAQMRYPWPWLGVLGAASGAMGGLFGVGGAVVATPVLTSLFGTTQVVAQGLSLALALPSTAVTLVTYGLHQQVNWNIALPMAAGGLLSISWGEDRPRHAGTLAARAVLRLPGAVCGDARL